MANFKEEIHNKVHKFEPVGAGHGLQPREHGIPTTTILKTERLLLRAVDFSDVDLVWEASRFEGFNDGMTWDPPECREEIVQITQRNIEQWRNSQDYVFTVCILDPPVAVGRVGLHREEAPGTWNLGFWIHPDQWGNGYAYEAARAVLDFGFMTLQASRVVTAHATWNKRSQSVTKRLGFQYLRENPAGFYKNSEPVAEYEYELHPSRISFGETNMET